MIIVDTSVLVTSLAGPKRNHPSLTRMLERGELMCLPTVVLYEWWRGPRTPEELAIQEVLFPVEFAIDFGPKEAEIAARIYRQASRARAREMDIAIAACAIAREAPLWTMNSVDFAGIPDLTLASIH